MTVERGLFIFVKITVVAFALAVAAVIVWFWWARLPPNRPKGVPSNAVWLWAPPVPIPNTKRGMWMSCRHDQDQKIHCMTNDKSGRVLYDGVFLPYSGTTAISDRGLEIDAEQPGHHAYDQSVFIGDALVPLVHLKGGEILIPAAEYDEGKRTVDSSKRRH
jgi:hypothetical protein